MAGFFNTADDARSAEIGSGSTPRNGAGSMATEAAWLYKSGWPLYALVDKYATNAALDGQTACGHPAPTC